MTVRLLIEAIVREMTVLLAELATSGGIRAPLANVADRVFTELARELDAHGVSRTVSADMFGLALRTYLRRIRRHDESVTQQGHSLWEAVLDFIQHRSVVGRGDVLSEFAKDDEGLVRSVLQDLTDSGLVFRSGVRNATAYRAAVPGELGPLGKQADSDALDHVIWAMVRREGPLSSAKLCERTTLPAHDVEAALARLRKDGRVDEVTGEGLRLHRAKSIVIPFGAASGWEAAVYDHFHAMVKTIVCKLRLDADGAAPNDRVGGSTYTFEVWQGHPLEERVHGQLSRFREATSALRREVDEHNKKSAFPTRYDRVTVYMGQCVVAEEDLRDT
jgi:hypothetical protein